MDPSHARKYTKNEIEGIVADLLNAAYPHGVSPPIKIDLLVEQHPEVDELIPVDFRDFDIDALLVCKPDTKTFDILFDENAVRGRISFSIAHEFGHAVLHGEICRECHTIQDAVDLHMRLRNHFTRIEADAQYFASAILMPRRSLPPGCGGRLQHPGSGVRPERPVDPEQGLPGLGQQIPRNRPGNEDPPRTSRSARRNHPRSGPRIHEPGY